MTQTDTADERSDGMVCSADGVVVRVRRRQARGEVPAYEYVVGSERDEPVAVRIRQSVPADVATEDLGFPSACEDHWTLDGTDLVAELVVEPGQQAQTIWGVRSEEHPSIAPPTVEATPVDGDDRQSAGADDGSLDLETPTDADLGGSTDVGSLDADGGDGALSGSDSVVSQLVDELETGQVSEGTRSALADALELHGSDSANAFVDHVKDKLQRRAEQLQDEVESLEDSVEQLYGVKADASEISSIKRGLSDLEDHTVDASDLDQLRSQVEEVQTDAARERAAVRQELDSLSEEAADAERVAQLAERVETLGEIAQELEAGIGELESRHEELVSRHEDLVQNHDDLAEAASTDEDLERVREDYRANHNATKSEIAAIRSSLQDEYTTADDIAADIDSRFRRSLGTMVFFAIGAVGLATSVPLALDGSGAAAVTMPVGAVALALWWHLIGSGGGSIFSHLPDPRSLLD